MTESHSTGNDLPIQAKPKCKAHNKRTQEEFIKLAKDAHGDTYDYQFALYVDNITKVKLVCRKHGIFEQTPKHHLRGEGCFQCGRDITGRKKTKTTNDFIADAKLVHGDKFDYSKSVYTGASKKLEIVCHKHGSFTQKATHHLGGVGCPYCAAEATGWSRGNFRNACNGELGLLYVIECQNNTEHFYKVGITSKSIGERFKDLRKMPYRYTEIFKTTGQSDDIYNLEKRLHALLKGNRYRPSLYFNGHTECFTTIEPIRKHLANQQEAA